MKKSTDILGLPVISIMEGKELGVVKDLLINAHSGSVAALVIDDGKWYLGAKLLPYAAISGLGEYAVTIDSSSHVISVVNAPELESLLAANVRVIGTKVITKSGRIQGKVTEIIIDATGKIAACEIEEVSGETTHIPAQRTVTYGKDVLIISETSDESVIIAAATARPAVVESVQQVAVAPAAPISQATPAASQPASQEPSDDSARKFDEKHRKYLLGKKATRRIETDNGMVIVDQGGEITEEVLQKAKLAGKFVELSMSIQ